MDNTVHMFWTGDNFQYLDRLSVLSHILVGHKPKMWLSGTRPNSPYWIDDFVEIKNADEVVDTKSFTSTCGISVPLEHKVRLASDLVSFYLMYNFAGTYCDCDVIALQPFAGIDKEIFVSDDRGEHYCIGIMATELPGNPIFKESIENICNYWGNLQMFTAVCKKYGQPITHEDHIFFPYTWKENIYGDKFRLVIDNDIYPDSKTIHYFGTGVSKLGVDETWSVGYPNSVLNKLHNMVFSIYPVRNNQC